MTRCNTTTSQQTRGLWEEKWTRGGGALQGRGIASREQEKVAVQQQGQCDNQLENKRQTGGEVSLDRVGGSIKRTRGGGGTTRGVAITSWQTRGKRGGGTSGQRGGGVLKAGGASR